MQLTHLRISIITCYLYYTMVHYVDGLLVIHNRTRLPEYCRAGITEVRPSTYNIFGNTCVLPRSDTEDNSFQMGSVYNVTVRAESGSAFRIGHLTNFNTNLHGTYQSQPGNRLKVGIYTILVIGEWPVLFFVKCVLAIFKT